jgi:hypothetical protein|tara:strand:- start:401 stop:1246 length:846 start_codon:yes stop_codon:yes gene_type:complete
MRKPLSDEHRDIISNLLRVEEHPVKGRILSPSTGGVETTLMAYMLCKYYEDNSDIELFFYTANLFEPPVELHDRMEDEYKPYMNALEGSTILYRLREKTTKQFSHMVRYFTQDEVEDMRVSTNKRLPFYTVKDFDVPYALDLIKQLGMDIWYTGRNRPYTPEQVRETVNYLEQDSESIDGISSNPFNDMSIPFVEQCDGYKILRPFVPLQKHEIISIYEQLDIMDLFYRTVSCPHINPGIGCHGQCQYMLGLPNKEWKNNCFERLTAETKYGIAPKWAEKT